MNVGSLRHRITIMRPPTEEDQDNHGQPTDEWQPVATVWASIDPLHGRELFRAMQANAEVTTKIIVRYRKDLDRTMIVKYGGNEFEILYVINPDYRNRELHVMCKERQ